MTQTDDAEWAAFAPKPTDPKRPSLGAPEFVSVLIAVLIVIGLVAFWPSSTAVSDATDQISVLGIPREFHEAVVTDVTDVDCYGSTTGCVTVSFELTSGLNAGLIYSQDFSFGGTTPEFQPGDKVVLSYIPPNGTVVSIGTAACGFDPESVCTVASVRILDGTPAGGVEPVELFPGQEVGLAVGVDVHVTYDSEGVIVAIAPASMRSSYQFADFQRRSFLALLVVVFAVAVVALGRWRGVAALAGLGVSLVVVLYWLIPSILSGNPAVFVALTGAATVAYLALYVSHGISRTTTIALLGTIGALALTTLLAWLSVHIARFTGLATEESTLLILLDGIDLGGLLLAGIVIGAAGALDDVTVTQANAVAQMRAAASDISPGELFSRGMAIGRAHVGSIVNTLVLAYLGAALPLTILFILAQQSLGTVVNSEIVAVHVVRTLVGTLGIIAAVPLTTWLATLWRSSAIHKH